MVFNIDDQQKHLNPKPLLSRRINLVLPNGLEVVEVHPYVPFPLIQLAGKQDYG